jgi:hypothetical protein
MPINCICPKCRKPLSIDEKYAGQPMKCPMCASMFQSPSLTAVAAQGGDPFSQPAGAGYEGPAPPWASAPPKDPAAPEWPWLVNAKVGVAAGEFASVAPGAPRTLAPGWHMVLRGMGLLPPAVIVIFITLVLARLFVLLYQPDVQTLKIVLLIVIPIVILAALAMLIGKGLCCLVPSETKLRGLAIAAAFAIFLGMLGAMTTIFFRIILAQPSFASGNSRMAPLVTGVMWTAFVGGLLLLVGGGVLFLLLLRGIAKSFDNKRLARHLLWYIAFFVLSPALGLFVLSLFKGTDMVLTTLGMGDVETRGAVYIVYSVVEFILGAIVLTGFLLMLRDTRTTIERAIVASKV